MIKLFRRFKYVSKNSNSNFIGLEKNIICDKLWYLNKDSKKFKHQNCTKSKNKLGNKYVKKYVILKFSTNTKKKNCFMYPYNIKFWVK